ncbi:MAG: alpha/beta hydrolase [Candidatus Limnocylindria bacterium]
MVKEVEFPSEGATLRGLLYVPESRTDKKSPLVIMAHGTSATVSMVADKYAEAFSRAGLAVLLYDHRNFGRSDGQPRQEINPWIQCRGYRDAVTFAETLDAIDPQAIALWGDSYTGGQVIVIGAMDQRVKAIVAQVPVFGAKPPDVDPDRATFDIITEVISRGDVRGSPETTVGPMPVVSSDQAGTPSLLEPIQAFRWFIDYGGRAGSRWVNTVTRVLPATPVPFQPGLCAPFVTAPTLLMVAPDDEMVHANYAVARQAYDLLPGPKQWYDIAGGHFGLLYWPSELFDEASRVQTEFLKTWLLRPLEAALDGVGSPG